LAVTVWSSDSLARIGAADEIQIAARRADRTLSNPVIIWVVACNNRLYIRSVNGRDAAWFRSTQATHEGQIRAGGVDNDVAFAEPSDEINDQLDAVYRAKYGYSPSSVAEIVSPQARSATLELVPQ
jgi:hypothetical protein